MSECVYADVIFNKEMKRGERVERVVEVYENAKTVGGNIPNAHAEDTDTKKNIKSYHKEDTAWSRCYRVTAVCVVLLCVVLITAVTVLWIQYNILNTENNQLQTSYGTLTIERDQLKTSYNNLTIERDQLKTSYNNVTIARDQLKTSYNNLTIERDRLQTRYNNLTIERDQLQTSYNNMTIERDKLQRERDIYLRILNDLDNARYLNSSLYFMYNEMKNWTESRQNCTDKGADLVIINGKAEQDFIADQLQGSQAWIGLSDRDTENVWKWVDGTLLTSGNWAYKQPDNHNNSEDCAETGYPDGQHWNDRPCSYKQGWICEKGK